MTDPWVIAIIVSLSCSEQAIEALINKLNCWLTIWNDMELYPVVLFIPYLSVVDIDYRLLYMDEIFIQVIHESDN